MQIRDKILKLSESELVAVRKALLAIRGRQHFPGDETQRSLVGDVCDRLAALEADATANTREVLRAPIDQGRLTGTVAEAPDVSDGRSRRLGPVAAVNAWIQRHGGPAPTPT
jgi:hypothetical protein